jgi:ribosomal protein S18 acetylase RimI-like enzyme
MATVPSIGQSVTVRPYEADDFEIVFAIDCAAFREGRRMSREKLLHHLGGPDSRALVADDGAEDGAKGHSEEADPADRGELVGYALACLQAQGLGYLKVLAVKPSLQNRGVGCRLLAEIEAWLWSRGAKAILLETANDETSARRFYERNGYFVIETYPHFYEDGGGAFRMLKDPEM